MTHFVETIQKNLGYNALHKIDPNTQDIPADHKTFGAHSLAQAAIPAILLGLFGQLESQEAASFILHAESRNWFNTIYGDKSDELLQRIAAYAGVSVESARSETEHIANEAVRLARERIHDKKNPQAAHAFIAQHRSETLLYLPASLQLGTMLKNENLDDRTNKMEGPVSSFLHKIEKQFNSSENN